MRLRTVRWIGGQRSPEGSLGGVGLLPLQRQPAVRRLRLAVERIDADYTPVGILAAFRVSQRLQELRQLAR